MDDITSIKYSILKFIHNLPLDERFILNSQIVYSLIMQIRQQQGLLLQFLALLEIHLGLSLLEVIPCFVCQALFEDQVLGLLVVTCSHALTDMIVHVMFVLELQLGIFLLRPHT